MSWEGRPGKSILVVEHDALTRGAIKLLLEWEDYRVTCAADGAEALDLLRRGEKPSLILLNVRRPGCDGWCFREEQRADPRPGPHPRRGPLRLRRRRAGRGGSHP
jgi:CheY-like chemotaxis protein